MKSKLIIFDLDDTLIDTSGKLKAETAWEDIKGLKPLAGVKEFLKYFPARKILVTKESVAGLQKIKLIESGILDLFEEVVICNSNEEKRFCFEKINQKNNEAEMWAVGDRIDSEIKYGNELGWKTVLIRRGKYENLKACDKSEVPNYEIKTFVELKNLLQSYDTR